MELFSLPWFGALASIIAIDLILAGDNAVVIALAARSLPKHLQRKAVVSGTFGAIALRIAFASLAIYLLKLPGIAAVGGLALFWIAFSLMRQQEVGDSGQHAKVTGFWGAMRTIIIADALMGLDNIIAVAGAARGDLLLLVIGLLVSIPIVMGGSILILRFIKEHPWIVWAGGALLGFTGGTMIIQDPFVVGLELDAQVWLDWVVKLAPTVFLFGLGWWHYRLAARPGSRPAPGK